MIQAHSLFSQIIYDAKSLDSTYGYMCNVIKPPFDFSDLLRWQWAQSVSALDKLVHDLVRIGMVQTYTKKRLATQKYAKFAIPLEIVSQMKSDPDKEVIIFENHISLTNGYKSFQDPNKIADALAYIWDENKKWNKIAEVTGDNPDNVKTFLRNSVIRRNQIVHQGDYDGFSLYRQEIDKNDTKDVLSFIEVLGNSIFSCVK